jgi:hypothetical protein
MWFVWLSVLEEDSSCRLCAFTQLCNVPRALNFKLRATKYLSATLMQSSAGLVVQVLLTYVTLGRVVYMMYAREQHSPQDLSHHALRRHGMHSLQQHLYLTANRC